MNKLLKLKRIASDRDKKAIWLFDDDIESHVRNLDRLGINSQEYGALLAPDIIERLPHQIKLITCRNIKDKIWDLTKILSVIKEELIKHENCFITDKKGGKSYLFSNYHNESSDSGSALVAN